MAIVEVREERSSTLGGGKTIVETPTAASRTASETGSLTASETVGGHTVTKAVSTPEQAVTASQPYHAGIKFRFTLKFRNKQAS